MKAIGFTQHLNINDSRSLFEFEESVPVPKGHDLLVKVNAVSVNPVDVGVRRGGHGKLTTPKVIGWDACGIVKKVGNQVSLFNPGDRVYYAGSSNSQSNKDKTILIINGAGGVGSVATQLAANAGLTVIATASRPESINWVKSHGAKYTVNHRNNLIDEVRELGYKFVDYILELKDIDNHWKEMCELIKPEGAIASITENRRPINLRLLTQKKAIFAWEWMYTKSYYHTNDMQTQHDILEKIAYFLDNGQLKCTLTHSLSPLNATNLRKAHSLVESGHMVGKVVVFGWEE